MKRFFMALSFAAFAVVFSGASVFASTIYLNDRYSVFSYDLTTGETNDIYKMSAETKNTFGSISGDTAYANGKFYASSGGGSGLLELNTGGTASFIPGVGYAGWSPGITAKGNTLYFNGNYGYGHSGSDTYNLDTGLYSLDSTVYTSDDGGGSIGGLEYGENGVFYSLAYGNDPTNPDSRYALIAHDTKVGGASFVGYTGLENVYMERLGFVDGQLLGFNTEGKIFNINLDTGAATQIGDIERQIGGFAGVAPTPIPGAVWILGAGLTGLLGLKRKFSKA